MDAVAARVAGRADAAVAGALRAVIVGMDNARTDQALVDELTAVLTAEFPSFLGFTITVQRGLRALTMTTAAPIVMGTANACLLLLLAPQSEPGSSAVFYADEPGTFDRLADSDEWRLCSYDAVVLDSYLQRA